MKWQRDETKLSQANTASPQRRQPTREETMQSSKRERIVIDARMPTLCGIGTYLMSLLTELASVESEFDFEVICREPEVWHHLPAHRFRFVESRAPLFSLREQWELTHLTRRARLLHCPHYNIPCVHRGPMVVTIQDLTHLLYPEFLPNRLAYWYATFMLRAATKRATRIVTGSEYTRKCVQERFHVSDERIRVVYYGLPNGFSPGRNSVDRSRLGALKVRRPYVLFVGHLKPHKNVQALLRAFSLIPAERRRPFQLVIVAGKDAYYPRLLALTKKLLLDEQVVFTGAVTTDDLQGLYADATLLVLPSLNEGFGYPVLEAMASGVPVVVSNTSSLPEVAGSAGILVDPHDPQSIANGIERLLCDDDLRQTLSQRGREQAQLFSARKFALDHLEVYRAALGA
jgi:glycosyltransferase involved in cell wall biosynthesis